MAKRKRIVGLSALAVTVVGGLLVEWLKVFPLFTWVRSAFWAVVRWLGSEYIIERWWLLLISLAAVGFLFLLVRGWIASLPPTASWLSYREDRFLDINWAWDYNSQHQLDVRSFRAYCPRCNLQLRLVEAGEQSPDTGRYQAVTNVVCDECGYSKRFEGDHKELFDRVARLAERKVRTGAAVSTS